ncbi:unnamed protein product, partial [Ectocarpus sp. 13 AM-2016]
SCLGYNQSSVESCCSTHAAGTRRRSRRWTPRTTMEYTPTTPGFETRLGKGTTTGSNGATGGSTTRALTRKKTEVPQGAL